MIHSSDDRLGSLHAVRDGQLAVVTCDVCGCRLEAVGRGTDTAWFHFSPLAGRDARGCRVACAERAHDASGRAAVIAA